MLDYSYCLIPKCGLARGWQPTANKPDLAKNPKTFSNVQPLCLKMLLTP